jgi:hypothetical protein
VKAVDAALPAADGFDDAEIEVYDAGRYSAMTGNHIAGTPQETTDCQAFLDAIQHTGPGDIRLRSTVTQERTDGSKSMDPSWAQSKSGTRLAEVGDGWVYRKGMVGLDALQVVALEERIVSSETEYPSGEDFWQAVEALRERGAHIPEYEPSEGDAEHTPVLPDREELQTATSGWDWRHAGEEPDRELTIDDARERTVEAIAGISKPSR